MCQVYFPVSDDRYNNNCSTSTQECIFKSTYALNCTHGHEHEKEQKFCFQIKRFNCSVAKIVNSFLNWTPPNHLTLEHRLDPNWMQWSALWNEKYDPEEMRNRRADHPKSPPTRNSVSLTTSREEVIMASISSLLLQFLPQIIHQPLFRHTCSSSMYYSILSPTPPLHLLSEFSYRNGITSYRFPKLESYRSTNLVPKWIIWWVDEATIRGIVYITMSFRSI